MNVISTIRKKPEAFEGDEYLARCATAAKNGAPWLRLALVAAFVAACIDTFNIHDLFARASHLSSADAFSWIVPVALVVVYVLCGGYAGHFMRLFFGTRMKRYGAFAGLVAAADVLFIASIIAFRFQADAAVSAASAQVAADASAAAGVSAAAVQHTSFGVDPLAMTLVYTAAMVMGAILSALYSYFQYEIVAEQVYDDARKHFADDAQLYDRVFTEAMADPQADAAMEQELRALDSEILEATRRTNVAIAAFGMVHDPADVYEVVNALERVLPGGTSAASQDARFAEWEARVPFKRAS